MWCSSTHIYIHTFVLKGSLMNDGFVLASLVEKLLVKTSKTTKLAPNSHLIPTRV